MTYDEFNAFCGAFPAATYVMQWGGSHVWKVGGKVFAIGGWEVGEPAYTFKTNPIAFEVLGTRPGCRPAPYLASRGMLWIQHYQACGLGDDELKDYLSHSYRLVVEGLSRKKRHELGLSV